MVYSLPRYPGGIYASFLPGYTTGCTHPSYPGIPQGVLPYRVPQGVLPYRVPQGGIPNSVYLRVVYPTVCTSGCVYTQGCLSGVYTKGCLSGVLYPVIPRLWGYTLLFPGCGRLYPVLSLFYAPFVLPFCLFSTVLCSFCAPFLPVLSRKCGPEGARTGVSDARYSLGCLRFIPRLLSFLTVLAESDDSGGQEQGCGRV